MRGLFFAAAAIALVVISAGSALACSCAGTEAPCQAYGEASAVFVGTVMDSRIINIKSGDFERQTRAVRLSIDTPFRGVNGTEVEVRTGMGGGDCGYRFVQAQQYLVYAYEHDGKFSTGICSRTRPIAKAEEDLKYIQGLPTAKPGGTISGKTLRSYKNEKGGMNTERLARITITIDGPTKRKIKTDAKGQYRVEGLPPGEYLVRVAQPKGFSARGLEQKVEVPDRGCAIAEFWLEPAGK